MELFIKLSRIVFRIILPYPVEIDTSFENFLLRSRPECWDAEVEFIQGCKPVGEQPGELACEDDQMIFYRQGTRFLCVAKGAVSSPMAYTLCDPDASRLVCCLNTERYPPLRSLGALIQLIPLKWFLSKKGTMLFHASQILWNSRGILFTAPSGTGKTTQAKLWEKYRGAEILRNDRVLVSGLRTFGFPYDGADPVFNPGEHGLHAIVCLGQSPNNEIIRLRPSAAIARVMQTLLFDAWDPQVQNSVFEQVLQMVSQIPVYQLNCTPDEAAVCCLENRLRKDGVIS